MMFSAVLPKLERDNVEYRLNQIEHVAMTKLNALNTQELQKVNNLYDHLLNNFTVDRGSLFTSIFSTQIM